MIVQEMATYNEKKAETQVGFSFLYDGAGRCAITGHKIKDEESWCQRTVQHG